MERLPEDRPPDAAGGESVDPFNVPARAVAPSGSSSPSAGDAAAHDEKDESDDAFWISSTGYQIVQANREAERRRAEVLDEARQQRPDLTDAEFAILTDHEFPLDVPWLTTPKEVLAYLDAARPRRRRRRSPTGDAGRPRLRESELRRELLRVLAELRDEDEDRPTQELVAERLSIDPSTLRRRLQRYPGLRKLLPTSGRPRRIERA